MELNRNTSQTIGTTPSVISYEQTPPAIRKVIFVVNTSTGGQKISLGINSDAVSGQGIVLAPGGYYQESIDAGFLPTQYQISAVSDLAAGTIAIHERIGNNGI